MRNIEAPQAFEYVGALANKKIKGQNFKRNEPGVIWDPKVIRLCMKLPYMKAVPLPEAMAATVSRTKKLQAQTIEQVEAPDEWWLLHHKRRLAIAKRLAGPNVDVSTLTQADAILEMHKPRPKDEPVAETPPAETSEAVMEPEANG